MKQRVFLAVVVALAALPLVGEYQALVGTLAVVFGLVALGFVVLTGWAGQLSLGQVLPYGLGGYAAAALANELGVPMALAIPLAAVAVIPVGVLVGLVAERLRGLDLAIGTFALALGSQLLVFGNLSRALVDETAGPASVVQVDRPAFGGILLSTNRGFYLYALGLGAVAAVAIALLGRSNLGRELRAIGDDPTRAGVTGVPVARLRLLAFVIAGVLAALGGSILASAREAVTPETFTAFESLNLLAIAVVGGLSAAPGAIIAGIFGAVLPEVARADPFRFLQGRLTLVYGLALTGVLVWRRGGLASLLGLDERPAPNIGGLAELPEPHEASERHALLRVEDLDVAYGGTLAVDGVSFVVAPGAAVALVGPNGAGKSSVFDVISGLLEPTNGQVFFDGIDITDHRPDQRAALGLGRTFQAARVFDSLTVAENLVVAAHLAGRASASAVADELIGRLGLRGVAEELPSALPFGSLRLLEVGLALAARPRLVLLDEPAAGMDRSDLDRLAALLSEVRGDGTAVLVVEHDLAFVGQVADRLIVLDQGHVIADGTPAAISRNKGVVEAFLGTSAGSLIAPAKRRATRKPTTRKRLARASR